MQTSIAAGLPQDHTLPPDRVWLTAGGGSTPFAQTHLVWNRG